MDSAVLLSRATKPKQRSSRAAIWIALVIAIVVAILGGWLVVGQSTPALPRGDEDLRKLPLRLGMWKGEDQVLSAEILSRIGADVCIERTYRNLARKEIHALLAVFSNWREGLHDNPIVLYKASGWQLRSQAYEPVRINDETTFLVSVSRWEKDQRRIVVLFWYQLGDHVLFQQSELDKLHLEGYDERSKPRLVKIQLEMSQSAFGEAESSAKQLAREIAEWLDGSP